MEANNIYFVGIGGIGMAALARYYLSKHYNVAGYDRTPSALTHALEQEGAVISYDDSLDAIPEGMRKSNSTLVVYTPAIPASNVPLSYFRDDGYVTTTRAAVLGQVTRGTK